MSDSDETPAVRIEPVVTSGTFSLDGGTWDVDNNVWVVGDDAECVIVDPAHDAAPILEAVGDRRVVAVLCTHAHDDHIGAAAEIVEATGAPTYLHPDDRMLWDRVLPAAPDQELADGQRLDVAGTPIEVLHTPGHSPGSCCFLLPDLGVVLTGDTLFQGGPGATGRSFSDFGTIIVSISEKLLTLPEETTVLTGHGDSTTIGDEKPHRQEWIDRGH
ncbi:glyoxylase-like metal-dependent hydrolase (beta-lactamase superfamily II) [Barrientosiimonas humi]|uniref:Glyoxylase-like metal-dependent hydrolase (Beta-lactamase superfamily II) n=1 Tax=Barrientosiimonas humi TaxID=999931 RepID=A0A542XF28_9MICO|nr:MBL fold metallo-hydrolase [Barrientosiimonas humi]TQL34406.1 glyoxylase-like metal-dependent hydrolase (beta-lactamase superfamily II) [Barrientosiimonas humi]CAG7574396.1 putative metallo-hydrolase [Barrientosiimonas humi]